MTKTSIFSEKEDILQDIRLIADKRDQIILIWLFEHYSFNINHWNYVADLTYNNDLSRCVWKPSVEGEALYYQCNVLNKNPKTAIHTNPN